MWLMLDVIFAGARPLFYGININSTAGPYSQAPFHAAADASSNLPHFPTAGHTAVHTCRLLLSIL